LYSTQLDSNNEGDEEVEYDDDNDDNTEFGLSSSFDILFGQSLFIPAALGLANLWDVPLLDYFRIEPHTIQQALVYTLPLIAMGVGLEQLEPYVPALQRLTRVVQYGLVQLLGIEFNLANALLVSIVFGSIAGVGEEMFFRGVLQEKLSTSIYSSLLQLDDNFDQYAEPLSVALVSVLFGFFHAATPVYALVAGIVSLYFGYLFAISQHHLLLPILCHSFYDMVAFFYGHYKVTTQLSPYELQQIIRELEGEDEDQEEEE